MTTINDLPAESHEAAAANAAPAYRERIGYRLEKLVRDVRDGLPALAAEAETIRDYTATRRAEIEATRTRTVFDASRRVELLLAQVAAAQAEIQDAGRLAETQLAALERETSAELKAAATISTATEKFLAAMAGADAHQG